MAAPNDRKDQMLELVRRWQESGQSARAFAQEQGVTPLTLYYWRGRLVKEMKPPKRPRKLRSSTRVRLAPVHVVTSGGEDGRSDVEITLAGGDRIRVSASVSVDILRRVVHLLRTAC